jgi:hypothetical protein
MWSTRRYLFCWEPKKEQWLRLAFSTGPDTVGVSLPSPEGGNRPIFRNGVLYSYLEFRTMDKVQKPSDSVIHHRQNPLDSNLLRSCQLLRKLVDIDFNYLTKYFATST